MCHHFTVVTELFGVCWVRCQGCVFPRIVNCPQCMTVAVGCPVKRPGVMGCEPKHFGMWHVGLLNTYCPVYFMCRKFFGRRFLKANCMFWVAANMHWIRRLLLVCTCYAVVGIELFVFLLQHLSLWAQHYVVFSIFTKKWLGTLWLYLFVLLCVNVEMKASNYS